MSAILLVATTLAGQAADAATIRVTTTSYVESDFDFTWKFFWDKSILSVATETEDPTDSGFAQAKWDTQITLNGQTHFSANIKGKHKVNPHPGETIPSFIFFTLDFTHTTDPSDMLPDPLCKALGCNVDLAAAATMTLMETIIRDHNGAHKDTFELSWKNDQTKAKIEFILTGTHPDPGVVPEPNTGVLLGLGLIAMTASRRLAGSRAGAVVREV